MVETRKSDSEESLPESPQQFGSDNSTATSTVKEKDLSDDSETHILKLESLPSLVAGVWSKDTNLQEEATTQFRRFLSRESCPPIEEVVLSGVVPCFVELLSRIDSPHLQYDAAWILTEICSASENIKLVIDHGGLPFFLELLGSPNECVREQAVLALATVAGGSLGFRDLVLNQGALTPLLERLNEYDNLSMQRSVAKVLLNLCKGKPQPPYEQTKLALQGLHRLVHSKDEEVLRATCWALACLCHRNDQIRVVVIEASICPRLVELLLNPSPLVVTPALRTVISIVSGGNNKIQHIIDNGALPCLLFLLSHNLPNDIKQMACWAIGNITAGNREQTRAAIVAGLGFPLLKLLQTDDFVLKHLAARAISNATVDATSEDISYWIEGGCVKPLCDLLLCSDPKVIKFCLMGLQHILEVGEVDKISGKTEGTNYYAQMIEEAEGFEKIQILQNLDYVEISDMAIKILETKSLEEE